jgi:hypothetical protein
MKCPPQTLNCQANLLKIGMAVKRSGSVEQVQQLKV